MLRVLLLCLCLWPNLAADLPGRRLARAHAHNDYEHSRPLWDALSHGFSGVEADIYLVDGKLLVSHEAKDIRNDRTLEKLYLDPLKELANGKKSIFQEGGTLTLLIDIKTDAVATYEVLRNVLLKYRDCLTQFDGANIRTNAITVILSGNRPKELLLDEKTRFASFDGRLSDLGKNYPVSFMPLVSDNWKSHFTWTGEGPLSAEEKARLKEVIRKTHSEGRRIRFWGTPDKKVVWKELDEAGVDLINTDELAGLAEYLRLESEK